MIVLDGKIAAAAVKVKIRKAIDNLVSHDKRVPHLAAILVGSNGASETYVASKIRNCGDVGIKSSLVRLEDDVSEEKLAAEIIALNGDPLVDGILVQLPLPAHISEANIISLVSPAKDVDGFHPINAGKLMQGTETFIPATPYGIILLLQHFGVETAGKKAVVIGRSNIVGRPMSVLLSQNSIYGNCTVTLCHSKTIGLNEECRQADIIVAALGQPGFLKAEMVKENAVVIDVGITRVTDPTTKSGFAIKGDVDYPNVAPKCSFITPVPGGVGLMTIAALLTNTLTAYEQRAGVQAKQNAAL